jgi:hypothetical protein
MQYPEGAVLPWRSHDQRGIEIKRARKTEHGEKYQKIAPVSCWYDYVPLKEQYESSVMFSIKYKKEGKES